MEISEAIQRYNNTEKIVIELADAYGGKPINIPDEYEVVDFRSPKEGDMIIIAGGDIVTTPYRGGRFSDLKRIILKRKPIKAIVYRPLIENGKPVMRLPRKGDMYVHPGNKYELLVAYSNHDHPKDVPRLIYVAVEEEIQG